MMTITRSKVRLAVALALVPAALLVNKATAAQPESGPRTEPSVVRTDAGLVRGQTSGTARVFNGIPYAAPPVQGLRWKAPQPEKH
jgi:para-nitrobenzyl esterase